MRGRQCHGIRRAGRRRVPAGSTLALSARFGNTPVPDATGRRSRRSVERNRSDAELALCAVPSDALAAPVRSTPVLQDVTFSAPALPPPTVSVNDVSVTEGNSGITNATFVISLVAVGVVAVSVAYATADGTASAGQRLRRDLRDGHLSARHHVRQRDRSGHRRHCGRAERNVLPQSVELRSTPRSQIPQGVGTIVNDDVASLTIGNVSVTEGDSGSIAAVFPVTLAGSELSNHHSVLRHRERDGDGRQPTTRRRPAR